MVREIKPKEEKEREGCKEKKRLEIRTSSRSPTNKAQEGESKEGRLGSLMNDGWTPSCVTNGGVGFCNTGDSRGMKKRYGGVSWGRGRKRELYLCLWTGEVGSCL